MLKWCGPAARQSEDFKKGVEVYARHFGNESVVRASCEDYQAGAEKDSDSQIEDQREGRKVRVPVLVVYSQGYLGSRYDVKKVWEEWVGEGVKLETKGLGNGIGHFLPEEAPKEIIDVIKGWVESS